MAGEGKRFGSDKMRWRVGGYPIWFYAYRIFAQVKDVSPIVLVIRKDMREEINSFLPDSSGVLIVGGGMERGDSVWNGLRALETVSPRWVMIHDCARPLVDLTLINRIIGYLRSGYSAVVPGIEICDTVKVIDKKTDGLARVKETLDRSVLMAIQTPQGFDFELIYRAYKLARERGLKFTDDAGYVEWMGEEVVVCEGDRRNRKLTYPEDWLWVERGLLR